MADMEIEDPGVHMTEVASDSVGGTGTDSNCVTEGLPETTEVFAGYPVHPAAAMFPLMVGEEFDTLIESIQHTRTVMPVELHEGKLIDGRNRCRAVEELQRQGVEIELPTTVWQPHAGETVEERIFALNVCRRHLTDDQRAVFASKLLPAIRQSRKERQAAHQFGTGGKLAVAQESAQPLEAGVGGGRTSQERFETSTIGQLAAVGNISRHKAIQAAALADGVASGEIPQSVFDDVAAGVIPLRKAAPKRNRRNGHGDSCDSLAPSDDGDEVPHECAWDSPLEAEVDRFWESLTEEVPVTAHRVMCRLLRQKIDEMEQQHGW
jgi:hypothetical protein